MRRKQFTFYESFFEAIRLIRRKTERCEAYEAIIRYALYGEQPEEMSDSAAMVMSIARPVLDSGRKKAESGQKGGSSTLVLRHLE